LYEDIVSMVFTNLFAILTTYSISNYAIAVNQLYDDKFRILAIKLGVAVFAVGIFIFNFWLFELLSVNPIIAIMSIILGLILISYSFKNATIKEFLLQIFIIIATFIIATMIFGYMDPVYFWRAIFWLISLLIFIYIVNCFVFLISPREKSLRIYIRAGAWLLVFTYWFHVLSSLRHSELVFIASFIELTALILITYPAIVANAYAKRLIA